MVGSSELLKNPGREVGGARGYAVARWLSKLVIGTCRNEALELCLNLLNDVSETNSLHRTCRTKIRL